jgi:hypothetical protein
VNGRGTIDAATQHVQTSYPTSCPTERKSEERWARREVCRHAEVSDVCRPNRPLLLSHHSMLALGGRGSPLPATARTVGVPEVRRELRVDGQQFSRVCVRRTGARLTPS